MQTQASPNRPVAVQRVLAKWVEKGLPPRHGPNGTTVRVAQATSTLRDFGVAARAVNKRIAPAYMPVRRSRNCLLPEAASAVRSETAGASRLDAVFPEPGTRGTVSFRGQTSTTCSKYHAAGTVTRLTFRQTPWNMRNVLAQSRIELLETDLKAVPSRISVYHESAIAILRYNPERKELREDQLARHELENVGKEVHTISCRNSCGGH